MSHRDERATWVTFALLTASAALVASIALQTPTSSCTLPANPGELDSLAGSRTQGRRSAIGQVDVVDWLEASWSSDTVAGPRSLVQWVITNDVSAFAVHPLWMTPTIDRPGDRMKTGRIDAAPEPVPFHLRANEHPIQPFAVGWIHAFEREAVLDPVMGSIALALRRPFRPVPPLTVLTADSQGEQPRPELREQIVTSKLEALWRDRLSRCAS